VGTYHDRGSCYSTVVWCTYRDSRGGNSKNLIGTLDRLGSRNDLLSAKLLTLNTMEYSRKRIGGNEKKNSCLLREVWNTYTTNADRKFVEWLQMKKQTKWQKF